TITLITTFQLGSDAVADTVSAIEEILAPRVLPGGAREPMPANPFRALDDRPVIHPYRARRYAKSIGHEVPLEDAVGRVAAEEVEVYPPGIPVILEGFRVSADAVEYLVAVLRLRGEPGRTRVHRRGDELLVPVEEPKPALERWYRRAARAEVLPRLDSATAALGRPYTALTIRNQRTRWGSCSTSGAM